MSSYSGHFRDLSPSDQADIRSWTEDDEDPSATEFDRQVKTLTTEEIEALLAERSLNP